MSFRHDTLRVPLEPTPARRLHAALCLYLAGQPAPAKDPELGSKHGGADKPWAKRERERRAA